MIEAARPPDDLAQHHVNTVIVLFGPTEETEDRKESTFRRDIRTL